MSIETQENKQNCATTTNRKAWKWNFIRFYTLIYDILFGGEA